MRNILVKYFFLVLICGFISCKSKKNAVQTPNAHEATRKEMEFGYNYVSGCTERMKGNLQEALKLFETCKSIHPDNAAVHYELGTIYKLLGKNQTALAHAKFCAEADKKNEWYQLLLVECYNAQGQYNQSVKIREQLVKDFPHRGDFKEDLAIEYAVLGKYDAAYKIYNELEKNYGINEQITINKVKLLRGQRKNKEAEQELIKLSDSDKNETRYYNYLADFYIEQGSLEKAKAMYDKIAEVNPNDPAVHLSLHDYYSAKGNESEAFNHLKKAFQNTELDINVKANILSTFYDRAREQPQSEVYRQGMELAKIMLQSQPNAPESNSAYADFLLLDNQLEEASKHYYMAAINESRNPNVWINLLASDYDLHRYDSLERHSTTALELFPSYSSFYFYNGIANIQLHDYKKAAQSLNEGLGFVVDNNLLLISFYSNLGDAYFNLKEFSNSDKAFDEALKIDADNTYVLNNYAYYLSLRNEHLDKAEKYSKRTNDLKPDNRNYQDTYAWILFQQKKYTEAETWILKAVTGTNNATILEHYGDILFKLNKSAEALKQWQAAKEAGGTSEELLKKIQDKKLND
ncbi:MAG: hypothetical protein KF900_10460 [Bacteroidetes bacterium]|nr:hypothetical protein [Bacteroidota bacterium]